MLNNLRKMGSTQAFLFLLQHLDAKTLTHICTLEKWRVRSSCPRFECRRLNISSFSLLLFPFFQKVAIALVDLLFIELMSHLSHVKQIYSQPIHLAHELMFCVQRVDFNGDSAVKSPCWPFEPVTFGPRSSLIKLAYHYPMPLTSRPYSLNYNSLKLDLIYYQAINIYVYSVHGITRCVKERHEWEGLNQTQIEIKPKMDALGIAP